MESEPVKNQAIINTTSPATPSSDSLICVLVLDDEEMVRTLAKRVLTGAGCTVETVADGREGLQILLQRPFDVMVVDLHMQGMDGIAFLKEALKIWPWLGVVIMSGFLNPAVMEQLAKMNIHHAVEKPVDLNTLIREVRDEARDKRALISIPEPDAPDRIQNQLSMLRSLGEMAITSENLVEALRGLGAGLGRLLPCSVVGILDLDRDDSVLILNCQEPVAEEYISHMKADMFRHYESLSGRTLSEARLRVQLEGEARSARGPVAPASAFAVPIIIGGELRGVLNLTSSKANALTPSDIAFLYHAANHLSTVLVALNRARNLAIRDGLSGVFNRRHLEDQLEHAWKLAERYGHKMGVAILDVDHFKQSNDTFGHLAGDQILREFAQLLQRVARSSDVIGRYGGDEFVVVLSKIEGDATGAFGERLLRAVRQHVFCESTLKLHLNCSLGIAITQGPHVARNTQQLLQQADYALYAAKRAGRNTYAVWSPDLIKQQETAAPAPSPTATPPPATVPASRGRVLVVDDDENSCQLIQRILVAQGYEVVYVLTSAAARQRVDENPSLFDVTLVDLTLGSENGLPLLDYLQSKDRHLIKIVITGDTSVENTVESLRLGTYNFVQKPIVPPQLLSVVTRAIAYRRLMQENERYQLHLEDMVREKSAALSGALAKVKQSYDFTLEALAAMLDARERITGQHSQRARKFTLLLARELGLPPEELEEIGRGALLHDIGKIGISDEILLNVNSLNSDQQQIICRHPEIGHTIISATPFLNKAAEVVLAHHERFDGKGYPRGLRGKEIPLGARIFAVIDAYDAMRSTRAYRKGLKSADAVTEIQRNAGTQFDPEVVNAFLRCQPLIESAGEWDSTP